MTPLQRIGRQKKKERRGWVDDIQIVIEANNLELPHKE
jgi:hypothetical protein